MNTILHVDLDAFYASVEQRDDPTLRGKPVLVGGSPRRGVVASCSYEARWYGIRSAIPMAKAMRRCPHAIVVHHRMERYADASHKFFAMLGDFSPDVEGLSLDEAFLDLTGSERLLGDARTVAITIKQRVRAELSLVASVLRRSSSRRRSRPTSPRGARARRRSAPVSVGHQETFDDDIDDRGELAVILLDQADRVAARLRDHELRACAVGSTRRRATAACSEIGTLSPLSPWASRKSNDLRRLPGTLSPLSPWLVRK